MSSINEDMLEAIPPIKQKYKFEIQELRRGGSVTEEDET